MDLAGLATSLLAAEGDKHEPLTLGVLVVIPFVLSAVLYRYASFKASAGASRLLLWSCLVPAVVGTLLAVQPLKDVMNKNYLDWNFISPRSKMLHYAAFYVPAGSVLLFAGLVLYSNHRHKMEG
jgi:hypothetical protein